MLKSTSKETVMKKYKLDVAWNEQTQEARELILNKVHEYKLKYNVLPEVNFYLSQDVESECFEQYYMILQSAKAIEEVLICED